MTSAYLIGLFCGAALFSWLLCRWLIRQLTRAAILDVPNDRSLHDAPIPRGAGVAISAAVCAGLMSFPLVDERGGDLILLLSAFGVAFAVLGWLDDQRRRSVLFRLSIQLVLAIAFVSLALPGCGNGLASVGLCVVAVGFLVWHVNLFNFMDGADGFSATHALTVALAITSFDLYEGGSYASVWGLSVAGALAGYLWWNWAPARVFMGDSGSYFLGFQLAAVIILAGPARVLPMLILVAPFVVDASLTLAMRLRLRQAWWRGHRQHAYQRLVLSGWSPRRIAGTLAIYNLGVCWPLAWIAATTTGQASAVTIAYLLTAIIWLYVQRRTQADNEV